MFFFALVLQTLHLGSTLLTVEMATTPKECEQGLMGRKEVPEGTGMLFVFPSAKQRSFWMKNTLVPLSIAFCDEEHTIFQIIDMPLPPKDAPSPPLFISSRPARYAIEVPMGWFQKKKIYEGMKFSFPNQAQ
ncbi:MAG: DUF192 domain-containing protein [Verrucomicrobiota bacterium]|nr:DUF192 domain-containing protein [Verrucomicrobiota bacterium]